MKRTPEEIADKIVIEWRETSGLSLRETIAKALREAREQGRVAGLEEAAVLLDKCQGFEQQFSEMGHLGVTTRIAHSYTAGQFGNAANAIRALKGGAEKGKPAKRIDSRRVMERTAEVNQKLRESGLQRRMHSCDIPGCVACGNPEREES